MHLFAQFSECKSTILNSICNHFQPSEREFVLRSSRRWHGLEPRLNRGCRCGKVSMMARKMKDIDTEEELVETFSKQMRISKGKCELFLKVLIGHFLVSECELAER